MSTAPALPKTSRTEAEGDEVQHRPALRERAPFILLSQLVLFLVIMVAWDALGRFGVVDRTLISGPLEVLERLRDLYDSGNLFGQILATMHAVALSLLIGVPVGGALGLVLGSSRFLDRVAEPFLVPLNSLPRIALAPLFIVWFGLTVNAKAAVGVTLVVFIMLFNTRAGVKETSRDLLLLADSLGMSTLERFRKIVLPGSVPVIVAGIRLSLTYALLGVIASEMIGARNGLGTDIVRFSNTLQVGGVFAILVILALISFGLDRLLGAFERRALRWQ
ncbi:ABC transporter permease [Ornithinimicrobium humiphilum]|uniref:NitT/TauT family transport system permease protein n=1 Tax=Ornithinimicrobium humiphilum TaxID=125288 RepID=A0A543KMF9_9MICO|nr:ABC transporter permease [Ornithinimicrobium humiphilum]TQM96214.1 NitT/TauT family transport system permease protein [Ornithinimicrobium humiphilum]